jgi:hypothetical protein
VVGVVGEGGSKGEDVGKGYVGVWCLLGRVVEVEGRGERD